MPELNLVGDYPNPYTRLDDKRRAIRQPLDGFQQILNWFPDREDMERVARAGFKSRPQASVVSSISSLLQAILRARPGSVARVNLFSHGAPGYVSLQGTITAAGAGNAGGVRFGQGPDAGLSRETIQTSLNRREMPEVRRRFAPRASLYLYVCNSGTGTSGPSAALLQQIAQLFRTRVVGLSTIMGYYVDDPYVDVQKWAYSVCVGSCEINQAVRLRDFHQLEAEAKRKGSHVEAKAP